MTLPRVLTIVAGGLLLLTAFGLLSAGAGIGLAHLTRADHDGYLTASVDQLDTGTAAIVADDIVLTAEQGTPGWVRDALEADVRLAVSSADPGREIFIGIAPVRDVAAFLGDTAHASVIDFAGERRPMLVTSAGDVVADPPGEEDFWVASASGAGTQEISWSMVDGEWSIVVMNADGSPGVTATADVGLKLAFLRPLSGILIGAAVLLGALAIAAVVSAVSRSRNSTALSVPPAMEQISP
jgi:hypothetical protein